MAGGDGFLVGEDVFETDVVGGEPLGAIDVFDEFGRHIAFVFSCSCIESGICME